MRRFIIYISIAIACASCRPCPPELQAGDLLFQAGSGSDMTEAIDCATRSDNNLTFTHVGIFTPDRGTDCVLEATSEGGVKITPMQEFLDRAARIDGQPAVVAMRLRDTTGTARSRSDRL